MHIIDKIKLDTAGRIVLTNYFSEKVPKAIGLAYDTEAKEIIIEPFESKHQYLILRQVDPKNRICLPPWLRQIAKDNLYLVIENDKRKLKIIDSL